MAEMKILLVDDEETFVQTLSERLMMRDLKSETAYDGNQAIDFINENELDVMVLDLKMPGIDGMEVLRQVKKKYPDIQVIILTGHGTDRDEEEARSHGVYDFLKKPVDIEELVDRIKSAYKVKIQNALAATAFAEEGEYETARDLMETKKK